MFALTLFQPWATFVAEEIKRIETRSWKPNKTLPLTIAIHSGKAMSKEIRDYCQRTEIKEILKNLGYSKYTNLPMGEILAITQVKSVAPTEEIRNYIDGFEQQFGDYSEGRYAWILGSVRKLKVPVIVRGLQKFWYFDHTIIRDDYVAYINQS